METGTNLFDIKLFMIVFIFLRVAAVTSNPLIAFADRDLI